MGECECEFEIVFFILLVQLNFMGLELLVNLIKVRNCIDCMLVLISNYILCFDNI